MIASQSNKTTLYGLESLRGIAALLVVIYHISRHIEQNFNVFPLGSFTEFGHSGVNFFFVLSGFIILYVHFSDIGKPKRAAEYLFKRFTRIYPFYWVVVGLTLGLIVFSSSRSIPELGNIILNLMLYPQGMNSLIVGVSWTLQYEIIFYLFFVILVLNKRIGFIIFSIWLMFLTYSNFLKPLPTESISIFSSAFNFLFFMGLLSAYLLKKHTIPGPLLIGIVGVILFLSIGVIEVNGLINGYGRSAIILYGFASMLIIISIVELERSYKFSTHKIFKILGKSSYSIYLVHLPINGITYQILAKAGLTSSIPLPILFLILFSAAVFGGILLSHYIELPLTKWIREKRNHRNEK